jgi:hypothetical protein
MPPEGRPVNQLSAEAQHVVNALEAHFLAVQKAVEDATPGAIDAVRKLGAAVLEKLEAWGIQFANHDKAVASVATTVGGVVGAGAASESASGSANAAGVAAAGQVSGGGLEGEPAK